MKRARCDQIGEMAFSVAQIVKPFKERIELDGGRIMNRYAWDSQ